MKIFRFLTVLALVSGLSSISFAAGQYWAVDFENGYNASSGTTALIGGDLADPYNTNLETCLLVDPDTGSHVTRVGKAAGSVAADIYYSGLSSSILGPSGSLRFNFKITQTIPASTYVNMFMSDYRNLSDYYWYVGLYGPKQIVIASQDSAEPVAGDKIRYYRFDLPTDLSLGWHSIYFTWNRAAARVASPFVREKANLRLTVDGVALAPLDNVNWTWPGNTRISIGAFRTATANATQRSGNYGVMIDNVLIESLTTNLPAWTENYWNADYQSTTAGSSGTVVSNGSVVVSGGSVQVGDATVGNDWLRYTDLPTAPANGLISIDFTTASSTIDQSCLYSYQYDSANYWWVGLKNSNTVIISSKANSPYDANLYTVEALLPQTLSVGQHNIKVLYQRSYAQKALSGKREKADVKVWLDGSLLTSKYGQGWVMPYGTVICVGSFYDMTQSSLESGRSGIKIDNISVSQPTGTVIKGSPVWHLDFENGFSASNGLLQVIGGDPLNPTHDSSYGNTVWLSSDAITGSVVAHVGSNTSDSALHYSSINPAICDANGTVMLDFKIENTGYPQNQVALFMSDAANVGSNYWVIGLMNASTVFARSHSYLEGSGHITYQSALPTALEQGWHRCKFTWKEKTHYVNTSNPPVQIRQKSDIRMWIDDIVALDIADANWSVPNGSLINVGSYLNGTASSMNSAKESVVIDNFKVYQLVENCGDLGTTYNTKDINKDCYVDYKDVGFLVEEWLVCSDPSLENWQKPIIALSSKNYKAEPADTITVDGSLSEWTDAQWVKIDQRYYGLASDIESAKYACKWDAANSVVYVAVKVVDTEHNFVPKFDYWNRQDALEVYVQGNNVGGVYTTAYDKAQAYGVGYSESGTWKSWMVDPNTYKDANPDPGFECAATLSGNEISYEMMVIPYDNYSGKSGIGETVNTVLSENKIIGLDVIVSSKSSSGFGQLCANMLTGKANNSSAFATLTCSPAVTAKACGTWGYFVSDFDGNCKTNLQDFASLVLEWLKCTDPANASCSN